jgi:predicted MFS family arabinose efflux permease
MGSFIGDAAGWRINVFQLVAEVALLAAMVMASSWLVRG